MKYRYRLIDGLLYKRFGILDEWELCEIKDLTTNQDLPTYKSLAELTKELLLNPDFVDSLWKP